jgi:antitoxin FitA
MVAYQHLVSAMPVNITLKNIPEQVYEALKASAERHRRSLNSEAIVCLEQALQTPRADVEQRLARIRALREQLGGVAVTLEDLDQLKREGRE